MKAIITAHYPPDEVRAILAFAARSVGLKHAGVVVKVKNSQRGIVRGMAYHGARLVTIGIGKPEDFPVKMWRCRQDFVVSDWREALVWVAAHEFVHTRDMLAGVKCSETTANGDAFLTLLEWRTGAAMEVTA
jgi:hypothetical protein